MFLPIAFMWQNMLLHKHQWMSWPSLSCWFRYSVNATKGQPDTKWSMVSVCLSHILQFGSAPFSNMFAWKFLVGTLWFCAAMIKPSVSDFRPNKSIHWWVNEEFKSGSLARIGYLPWKGLSSHPSLSSLIFLVFTYVLIVFCFFRRCRVYRNVVSTKVNLM